MNMLGGVYWFQATFKLREREYAIAQYNTDGQEIQQTRAESTDSATVQHGQ